MARKYLKRKRPMKPMYRKKKVRRNRGRMMRRYRTPVGIPAKKFVKLRYTIYNNDILQSTTIPVYAQKQFQSSLQRPCLLPTGTVSQPLYYDQWSTMYAQFRVMGFKYRIKCTNVVDSTAACYIVTYPSPVTTLTNDRARATQRLGSKGGYVSAGKTMYINGYVDVARTIGVPKGAIKMDDNFIGSTGGSPNKVAYLNIEIFLDRLATTAEVSTQMELTYYAELFFPGQVAPS